MTDILPVGELRHRVTLEKLIDVLDDAGASTRTYEQLALVWAQVTPTNGVSRFEAARQESSITHVVQIRWRDDVEAEMRFVLGARRLLIHAVFDTNERRRFLTCHCEEIKP